MIPSSLYASYSRALVDVTLEMQEDKQYFVGRIEFLHNDTTRDKVARVLVGFPKKLVTVGYRFMAPPRGLAGFSNDCSG